MIDVAKLTGIQLGSYCLGDLLGRGAFGAVYRADVVVGGQVIAEPVAVKILDPVALDRRAPLRELENAASLRHPHLVEVLGHPGEATVVDTDGVSSLVYWFAMERAEETLASRLRQKALTEAEAGALVEQIGGALAWLHGQGLVHRDVKPGNILWAGEAWKLGDLGLTRRAVEGYYAQLKGTTLYLAPESFDDPAPGTAWDVWAFGVTVLEAVTGVHPKGEMKDSKWMSLLTSDDPLPLPDLPGSLAPLIQGCLEKESEKRWTAERLIEKTLLTFSPQAEPPQTMASISIDHPPHLPEGVPWKVHSGVWRQPGRVFQDATFAPRMVVLPRGDFVMGSPEDEPGRFSDEGPQRRVGIGYDLALGECAVSFAEWDVYTADHGYHPLNDCGWGRGDMPAINVSMYAAHVYLAWLNERLGLTGRVDRYRLPSESEWEYGARGGTDTPFWWGRTINPAQANYDGRDVYEGGGSRGDYRARTVPVRSFAPNPFGLFQVHGNVWEWVEDAWHNNYQNGPFDGSVWAKGAPSSRVLRGGSWSLMPNLLRSANRFRNDPKNKSNVFGFRVAKTLES